MDIAAPRRCSKKEKQPPGTKRRSRRAKSAETIREFALNVSTAHGLPNIFRAQTKLGRLVWSLIFIIGVMASIWQGTILVLKYLDFKVATEVKIVTRSSLGFPAVTVCNTNKLRRSAISRSRYRQMLVVDHDISLPYYAPCNRQDFLCEGRPVCIKWYLVCDGIRQCGAEDTSDEKNCIYDVGSCASDEFRCVHSGSRNGLCIPGYKKCNRRKDCYEGEDEDDCECKSSEFKCEKRGGCIPKKSVCDAVNDCIDFSDEKNCNQDSGFQCDNTTFKCVASLECIPKPYVCDGASDCTDGSDESSAVCEQLKATSSAPPLCGYDHFMCGDGRCILNSWVCDSVIECSDGADESETHCGQTKFCSPGLVRCATGGGCANPCNLVATCPDGGDERNCSCRTLRVDVNGTRLVIETEIERVSCTGIYAKNYSNPYYSFEYILKCNGNLLIASADFQCIDGLVTCYDPITNSERLCRTVYHECYTSPDGQDYRGAATDTVCLRWNSPAIAQMGYTGAVYAELEGFEAGSTADHAFCRNPGGLRAGPWCFAEEASNDSVSLVPHNCTVGPPSTSCSVHPSMVFHECYTSPDGQDYRGAATDTVCQRWNSPAIAQMGYTGAVYAELEGVEPGSTADHAYCRNPGGLRAGPWCFAEEASNDSVSLVPHNCTVGPPSTSCSVNSSEGNSTKARPTFSCRSGESVPFWQTCNGFPDCLDGSDEWDIDCGDILSECGLDEFQCREKTQEGTVKCIPKIYVCDYINHCVTGVEEPGEKTSDESACVEEGELLPSDYYLCDNGHKMIHKYDVCNTVPDCYPEGDDEYNCTSKNEYSREAPHPFANSSWHDKYEYLVDDKYHFLFESFRRYYFQRPFHRVKGEDPADWNGFVTFSATPTYADLVNVPKLSKEEVRDSGHQETDFIVEFGYDYYSYDYHERDLGEFQDDTYGNCFTFNPNGTFLASKTSSKFGLYIILFLEQSEYISIFGQEAGVRVAITPPGVPPNPTDNGFTVKPGAVTSIGLRYNFVNRKSHPYGKCQHSVEDSYIIENGTIRRSTKFDQYDRGLCEKSCVHFHIREVCGCSDTLELDGPRCQILNIEQDVCKQLMYFLHQSDNLTCNCPQQCSEMYYTKTISTSTWPSDNSMKHLLKTLNVINPKTKQLNGNNIGKNLALLQVYYEELNYESTKEEPAYQSSSLFGDIGGIIGLYIGFSFITVFEFVSVFYKLLKNAIVYK